MIGYLRGSVLSATPEKVLLDVQGVGYEVHIPLTTFHEVERASAEGPVSLHIHTHVREDALSLFGFWTPLEKDLFERLLGVSGIGPRLARTVLSSPPEELIRALAGGDLAYLSKTPGFGKKTAERIVLELKDKVREIAAQLPEGGAEAAPAPGDNLSDLVSALVNLGYKAHHAEEAVRAARKDSPEAPFHELLRLSLQRLARV